MKHIYIFCFLILISLPFSLLLSRIDIPKIYIRENRTLAQAPKASQIPVTKLPAAYEAYLNDNLPFRSQFIAKYMNIWEMGLSSFVRENLKGKEGHYFSNSNAAPTIYQYLGLKDFTKEQLYLFRTVVAGRQAFWKAMGAEYLFILLPDKVSLYPEYLPDWIEQSRSWYGQLSQVIENTPVNYMDAKKILEANKDPQVPLCNKIFDIVHWNGNALDIMYREISRRMGHNENFHSLDDPARAYTIVPQEMFAAPFTRETVPWMRLNTNGIKVVKHDYDTIKKHPWIGCDIAVNSRVDKGTLLFATDSYFKASHQDAVAGASGKIFPLVHNVHKFISVHYVEKFSVIRELAEKEKPDMVIDASVERAGINITEVRPPRLLIAGEMVLNQGGLVITPELVARYKKNKNCTLVPGPDRLEVRATNNSPVLNLPDQRTNKDGRFVVMVRLDSPVATRAHLYYAQGRAPFKGERRIVRQTRKGINYLHFPIYARPDETLKLRFDPGMKKANYTILPMPDEKNIFKEGI